TGDGVEPEVDAVRVSVRDVERDLCAAGVVIPVGVDGAAWGEAVGEVELDRHRVGQALEAQAGTEPHGGDWPAALEHEREALGLTGEAGARAVVEGRGESAAREVPRVGGEGAAAAGPGVAREDQQVSPRI